MTFGDPIIYHCPSCRKMMKMLTFRSYTSRSGSIYSDSYFSGGPHFTSDLAKCPHCKKLFFRHNDKNAIEMDIRTAGRIKYIEDPWLEDLLGVITNNGKIAKDFIKNRKEEKTYRFDLWHELNKTTRGGRDKFSADELELWKNNCAALLPLMEKTLKEIRSEKNSTQYRDKDRDNCLIQTAELNRNLGNFDECMNLINKLNSDWDWLKKQFERECEAKNIFTFELLSENELNSGKEKVAPPPKPEHGDLQSLDIKSPVVKSPENATPPIKSTTEEKTFETPDYEETDTAAAETVTQNKEEKENEFIIFDDWTEIADWHFIRDSTYTGFVIHDNITRIGKCAFAQCSALKKLDIGKNVINIEKYAFRKDNRPWETAYITEVINRSVKPQIIDQYHFYNNDLSKAVLRVPEQSMEAYQAAEGWKDFGTITALDETQYPPCKIRTDIKLKTAPKKKKAPPCNIHIWIGNFDSAEELEEYADNAEYEWEYYGHLLGEDNFDEPPEEYGLGCAFCYENEIMYEDAADIADDLFYQFYDTEQPLQDIFAALPVDTEEALEACKEKIPLLKKANAYIVVFGWHNKRKNFQKARLSKPCCYLGEFEIVTPEPDTDGKYEAWS